MFSDIFYGKKVLITGHTGFKGSWLSLWLNQLGANVSGFSFDIPSVPSHFVVANLSDYVDDHRIDVRDGYAVTRLVKKLQPDFLFHLAAQALVRPSYENPVETMMTNAIGSVNILEALRSINKQVSVVMITSDKAYDNVEWVWGYRETDKLGGKDPYSASKGMAEMAIRSFVDSYFTVPGSNIRVAVTRAGNVIGGGDWASDRIVPDCMNSWSNDEVVDVRNPDATRPWQHVLEPLSGYLELASQLSVNLGMHGEAYNFGPPVHYDHTVRVLIDEMANYWDSVHWNDVSGNHKPLHEASLLKLNCDKALFDLQWKPTLDFEETVRMTVEWYKNYYQNCPESMYEFSLKQIMEYTQLAIQRDQQWTK